MSTRDDLIAVKALIDTPEKWRRVKGIVIAISRVSYDAKDRAAMVRAVRSAGITGGEPHPMLMAMFDRAIDALPRAKP